MSQAFSISARRRYGRGRVCTAWRVSRATLHRHLKCANTPQPPRRRSGPQGAMSDGDLAGRIRALLEGSPFHGEGYRKVWARLRHQGVRTSPKSVLRIMREQNLLAHQRSSSARGPRAHDGRITTDRVDEMWGTDMTSVATGQGQAAVFIAIDHCSAECVGIHASASATRFEALEPIRQGVRASFGAFAGNIASGLKIRHDHGSQYMSRDFQNEIRFLGADSSPAFVRAPEGNGCAERFIRTLKENLLWVRWFETIEDLRKALLQFQRTYNEQWIIERHGHRPPAAIRQEQSMNIRQAA